MAETIKTLARRLKHRQKLRLSGLDGILDVQPSRFERTVARLVSLLAEKDVRLVYDPPVVVPRDGSEAEPAGLQAKGASSIRSRRHGWLGSYQAEVAKLPRLSRPEEFIMARRYHFLKARVAHELRLGGVEEEKIPSMVLAGFGDLEVKRSGAMTAARIRRIKRGFEELEEQRNRYIEGALYIVLKSVHRYTGLGIDTVDLIQEGNASLFQAVEGFDWTRDVRFKTYAEYWINQAFLKMLYNNVRTVRIPVWVQKALRKINTLRSRALNDTGKELSSEQIGKELGMPAGKVDELLRTNRYAVSLDAELPGEEGSRLGDMIPDDRLPDVSDLVRDVSLRDRLDEVMGDLPDRERLILRMRFGLDGQETSTLSEVGELLDVSAERVRQLQEAALRRLKTPRKLRRLDTFTS